MDYSSGVVASRGPGDISLIVLEDVYAHTDSWNSFQYVEPPLSVEPGLVSETEPAPGTTLATTPAAATGCSNSGDKSSCNSRKNCKWKKDQGCIAKSRRLEEADCDYPYDPTKFDIPPSANLLACTSETVTFELVKDNIATRYNVVLSHHMRRKRQLRGSW